jgi:purine-nucleoside phosphorylase
MSTLNVDKIVPNLLTAVNVNDTLSVGTAGDLTLLVSTKGIVMTNAAGTITKRVRLNNTGDGLIFEDV